MSARRESHYPMPPATRSAVWRVWETILAEQYPGTKWTLRYDPDHAGEITYRGDFDV